MHFLQKLKASLIKLSIKLVFGVFLFLLSLISWQYFLDVKYKFPLTKPFSGHYYYNPYKNLNPKQWKCSNFHLHTRAWKGLSNGFKNSPKHADSLYHFLGYSIYAISNYQRINRYEAHEPWFFPTYEHGYLTSKNHQLVLNAKSVCWLDYFFPQTLSNKQHIIDELKTDTSCLLAIAHPHLQNRYAPADFNYLCNYDMIEVLNYLRFSIAYWDSALSTGHPSFIASDDDAHDVSNIYFVGRNCMFINTPLQHDSILSALKKGCAYGADIYMHDNESFADKKNIIKQLPHLTKVTMLGDTMLVQMNQKIKTFKFIGQNGHVKKEISDLDEARYIFTSADTYIRTEIFMEDKSVFYLNPVFKYNGTKIPKYHASVDLKKTWEWRIAFFICLLLCAGVYKKFNSKRNHG